MTQQKKRRKEPAEVVTLKVEPQLVEAMRHVPNRSAFIRTAILNALQSACPLCQGTGVLSPRQKEHWDAFAQDHALQECRQCNELRLICKSGTRRAGRRPGVRKRRAAAKGGR
jgi:hypothetical protein